MNEPVPLIIVQITVVATERVLLNVLMLFSSRQSLKPHAVWLQPRCFSEEPRSCTSIYSHLCEGRKHHFSLRDHWDCFSHGHAPTHPLNMLSPYNHEVWDGRRIIRLLSTQDKFRSPWLPARRSSVSSLKLRSVGESSSDSFLMFSNFYSST